MIEAIEFATPTQLEQHRRYKEHHRKFFPNPPPLGSKPVESTVPPPPVNADHDWLMVATATEPLTINKIKRMVAARWNVNFSDLSSQRRTRDIVVPRHIVCLLARVLTGHSFPMIGKALGDRDHTTVLVSVKKYAWLEARLRQELDLAAPLEAWVNRTYKLCGGK